MTGAWSLGVTLSAAEAFSLVAVTGISYNEFYVKHCIPTLRS